MELASPNRARFLRWLYTHNAQWAMGILLAFFVGMAVSNGKATSEALDQQENYFSGKVQYHVHHEKILSAETRDCLIRKSQLQ
jgi:hypothetical protein